MFLDSKVKEIVKRILDYSDSYKALSSKVRISNGKINVEGYSFITQKPLLVSVGKSALKMAKFFLDKMKIENGIVITPKGHTNVKLPLEVLESSHPDITERSYEAGKKVINLLFKEDYDLLIFLISGGASALMEYSDISLNYLKEINHALVTSGLSIEEINIVRKHLSLIKGGWLAQYSKSPILTLVISDVPGGDLSSVGSGPTILDFSTREEAERIMKDIGLKKYIGFLKETPKTLKVKSYTFKILDIEIVLTRLKSDIENSEMLSSEVRGDAYSFGVQLAGIANTQFRVSNGRKVLLLGGEPDVKITGKHGKGGRNGEICLGFLKYIKANARLYAIATDGIDGNSEYAGCYVDNELKINSVDIHNALINHSSYELLEKYGVTIKTGFTGDNVNNVYIVDIGD